MRNIISKVRLTSLFLMVGISAVGLFHEYLSAAFSLLLCAGIIWLVIKNGEFKYKINLVGISLSVMLIFHLLSPIWAVDSGMSFLGFFKFLPVFLFIVLMRQEGASADEVLAPLPYFGAVATAVSAIFMNIPFSERYFSVAGRLAGTVQYPNTWAIFCLVCIIIALGGEKVTVWQAASSIVLLFGVFYTGSRTVFILTALTAVILFFRIKSWKIKLSFIGLGLVGVIVFSLYVLISNDTYIIDRLMSISFKESTFVGRILYWQDALPQILKRPFGMGYMGYYFSQETFQSGKYYVMYAHNDLIQLLLDVGWIPALLFVAAFVKSLFSKMSFGRKAALIVFTFHVLFDFDLQFASMFIVYCLLLDCEGGKEKSVKSTLIACISFGVLAIVSLYFSVATALHYYGKEEASLKMYGTNTMAQMNLLVETDDIEEANRIADDILKHNDCLAICYNAKSRYAYSKGNFADMMIYKRQALERRRYTIAEYEDYCNMLAVGYSLYVKAGDMASANVCKNELISVPDMIQSALDSVSPLGNSISYKVILKLSDEIVEIIEQLEAQQ